VQPTALGYAAAPFKYWRGKIKMRFEFVCSKFHRGKVLFKYEPNVAQWGLISSNTVKLNQQNTVILDLQESQEICLEFDWAHPRAWAETTFCNPQLPLASLLDSTDSEAFPDDFSQASLNGYLEVRPLNELVQPTDLSSIMVNVYVSCPDLQVAFPNTTAIPDSRLFVFTESKEVSSETINPTGSSNDKIYLEHFGEKVLSFRSLLKRYTTAAYYESNVAEAADSGFYTLVQPIYPGLASPITSDDEILDHESLGERTIYQYLRQAYLGVRGGMRFRVIPTKKGAKPSTSDYVRVSLLPPDIPQTIGFVDYVTGLVRSVVKGLPTYNLTANLEGTVNHHLLSNGGVEFETPFYSNNIFAFSINDNLGAFIGADH
jgi:hypothetical protein